ncbi:MFS transporter [Ceratobasidium theobromae]|uniref:MFS transporter n=1 Tax=Ceratobasidium theobromae TaxID=1582974 RepID=A0A5N5QAF6_9AGAM|nr:MFS transporter [Ceratobasidium theobromae]
MLIYLVSFLDRVNIGNARLFGLEADLGMKGTQFQLAVAILFVTYLLFEVPSNLVIKKLRPSRYIAFITFAWGVIATLTGIVQSYGGLIACRLILGVFEAGPGMTVYLTFWYTRKELALRIGYLFVSAALAGAFGGLLATGIGQMEGVSGLRGWRWIIIIEGLPAVVLGCLIPFVLADNPESATWLTREEKAYIQARKLRQQGETSDAQKFHWNDVQKCFKDPKVYAFAAAQFGCDTMLYGFRRSDVPPCCLCFRQVPSPRMVLRRRRRRISPRIPHPDRTGLFRVDRMGLYVIVGIPLSWLANNVPRYAKRTSATGFQITIGNASGVMAPFLYATNEKPRYVRGHAVSLSMVAFAACVYASLIFVYARINARRERGEEDYKIQGKTREAADAMGDDSPHFRYIT